MRKLASFMSVPAASIVSACLVAGCANTQHLPNQAPPNWAGQAAPVRYAGPSRAPETAPLMRDDLTAAVVPKSRTAHHS